MRWLILAILLPVLGGCTAGRGAALHHPDLRLAELAGAEEGSPELFRSYRVDGPVLWSQGWPWKLDLSGVAWDQPTAGTAITPRHVVMAQHFPRKPGQQLVFHDRAGKPHSRTLLKIEKLNDRDLSSDVAVGLLDRALPESVRCYPLPAVREDNGAALVGATVLVTEQKRRLFFNRIANISGNWLSMRHDHGCPKSRRISLITGDSGHPTFILSKGELVLVETHTYGTSGGGPWYGSAEIQKALREVLRETDPAHTFRTIELDAPTLADARAGREAVAPRSRPQPGTKPLQPPPQPSSPGRDDPQRPRVIQPPRS